MPLALVPGPDWNDARDEATTHDDATPKDGVVSAQHAVLSGQRSGLSAQRAAKTSALMPRRAYIEALLHLNDIELDIGGDIGIVVDVVTGEAEQLQEFLLVAGVVGDVEQVVAGDLRPQFLTGLLDVVLQPPVVETQTMEM
mgnify:CR=1 FL=1